MADDAKTRQLNCGDAAVDRISNLPRNLIDLILKRLPLHDAAKTSILCKKWRDIWVMHPHLVFDELFFSRLVSKIDKYAQLSEVSKTISNILLVHTGPILKFHLCIPPELPLQLDTILWIKNLSNNGVRKLELHNKAQIVYKMPSYLFSCMELTRLRLTKCTLTPPLRFGGFTNLISVGLLDVIITVDISFGAQLEDLDLCRCTGIEHLGCNFKCKNNLTVLSIQASGEIDWRWFKCTEKVEILGLGLKGVANSRKQVLNLDSLVGTMPRICSLRIDSFFLKFLEPGASVPKRLETTMENLQWLCVYSVGFYYLSQIQHILCLITSLPNLQYLYIRLERKENSTNGMETAASRDLMVSSVVKYLQLLNLIDMIFEQLETVEIEWMAGSRSELRFIKLLLASSPSLKWMKLFNTTIDDPKEELRISRELLRFPRASTSAQIIWT